jgi:hypothetical protein
MSAQIGMLPRRLAEVPMTTDAHVAGEGPTTDSGLVVRLPQHLVVWLARKAGEEGFEPSIS